MREGVSESAQIAKGGTVLKIHDISMTISENMMVYKNLDKKKPRIFNTANFETDHHYETDFAMNMHTGTHIDAPLHMMKNGQTMESYDIQRFVTPAKVIDLVSVEDCITEKDLLGRGIEPGDFVLMKTKNSFDLEFNPNFVFLEQSGARYLQEIGISGVGIDALGIERSQANHKTHLYLLGAGIMIVEGLMLKEIEEGNYQLIVLPLKIQGVEAAPARAILIE